MSFPVFCLSIMLAALALLPGMAPAAAEPDAAVRIALRHEALVATPYVTLADVAEVTAANAGLQVAIERLRLGAAPRVGQLLQIGREELAQAVRTRVPLAGVKAAWSGADAVKVQSASQSFDGGAIVESGRAFLQKALAPRFAAVEVRPDAPSSEVLLPRGAVTLTARAGDLKRVYARMPVWVDIAVDGSIYRSIALPFKVSARQKVVVARMALPEGARVSAADFDVVQQDVAGITDAPVTAEGLTSARLRKALQPGDILMRSQLATSTGVLRGDIVTLVVAQQDVRIETRAVAQQAGDVGQQVNVKPEQSDAVIPVRIVSAGVVQAEGR